MKTKSKQMNRCFTALITRETHIKNNKTPLHTPARAEIQITGTRFGDDVEQRERRCWWEYKKGTDRKRAWETVLWFPTKVNILLYMVQQLLSLMFIQSIEN